MKILKQIIIIIFCLLFLGLGFSFDVGDTIKFNFQPATITPPDGYIADVGHSYAEKPNGLFYGWVDENNNPVVNNKQRQIRAYDGYIRQSGGKYLRTGPSYSTYMNLKLDKLSKEYYFQKKFFTMVVMKDPYYNIDYKWKIRLPNGKYRVKLGGGDPNFLEAYGLGKFHYKIIVQNKMFINKVVAYNDVFYEKEGEFVVKDGELIISAGESYENIMGFVEIEILEVYQADIKLNYKPTGLGQISKIDPAYPKFIIFSGKQLNLNISYGNRYFVKENLISMPSQAIQLDASDFQWDGLTAKLLGLSLKQVEGSFMIVSDTINIQCLDKRLFISDGVNNYSILNKGNAITIMFYDKLGDAIRNVDRQIVCINMISPSQTFPFEENEMIMKQNSFNYHHLSSNGEGIIDINEIEKLNNPYPKLQPYFIDILVHQLKIIDKQEDIMTMLGLIEPGKEYTSYFEKPGDYRKWLEHFAKYVDKKSFVDAFTGTVTLKDIGLAYEIIGGLNCSIISKMSDLGLSKQTCVFKKINLDKFNQDMQFYTIEEILNQSKKIINTTTQIFSGFLIIENDFATDPNSQYIKSIYNSVLNYNQSNFLGYGITNRINNMKLLNNGLLFQDDQKTNLRGLYNVAFELNQSYKGIRKLSRIYLNKDAWTKDTGVEKIVGDTLIEDLLEFRDSHGNEIVNNVSVAIGNLKIYQLFQFDLLYITKISNQLSEIVTDTSFTYHSLISSIVYTLMQGYHKINLSIDYGEIISALNY